MNFTMDMLEDYRFCPMFYKIKSCVDKRITRFTKKSSYFEAIAVAVSMYFEHVFVSNAEPMKKDFLSIVMKVFDKVSRMTSEEKFINTGSIDQMLRLASSVFDLASPLWNNIVVHPVTYHISLNHGLYTVAGKAFPVVMFKGRPAVFTTIYSYIPDAQLQLSDLNLSGYLLWLLDNIPNVTSLVYLDLRKIHKKFFALPLDYTLAPLIQSSLANICDLITNDILFPQSMNRCNNCIGNCSMYLNPQEEVSLG